MCTWGAKPEHEGCGVMYEVPLISWKRVGSWKPSISRPKQIGEGLSDLQHIYVNQWPRPWHIHYADMERKMLPSQIQPMHDVL